MERNNPHAKGKEALLVAQRVSDHDQAGPSHYGANDKVRDIFLSHSGKQKRFVEHLYDALQRANHTAFFDKHTLPKGEPFPDYIKRAAQGCQLGVVVLSHDFLSTKWPMLELEILVLQRGCNAKVLPLFYELHPDELRNPENLFKKWRPAWEKIRGGTDVKQWERALKVLGSFNGLVFRQGSSSEAAYIQEVVHRICDIVGYSVPYDLSYVQGHERFAKEIASMFEPLKVRHGDKSICMVGVHGVGGLGKTTLCKTMVNFYTTQYLGRSSLIEFPSDGDKSKIVQECKRALEKLTSFRNERVLHEANDFDQVVSLMVEHVKRYDMFLAIDNVWESCRVEAERLLGVGFSGSSKILLTSRSEQVLQDVLFEHTNTSCVMPLPVPENEEAFQIFQRTFKLGNLRSLVDRNEIDRVLERCKFSGSFHALALEAFGQCLKQVCLLGGLEKVKAHLLLILEDMSDTGKESLEDVIKLNYDILPEHKKHMFLDVAFSFRHNTFVGEISECSRTCAKACKWLGWLYKKFAGIKIKNLIYELALDGLIQIGPEDEDGERRIGVHDLYLDLAKREATNSSRFLMDGLIRPVEEMEWERLERAFVEGDDAGTRFFEKLEQQECRKLQVLCADSIRIESGIHLNSLSSLCVLTLQEVTFKGVENRSAASRVLNLSGLVQLQALWLERCNFVETITGLDTLQNLQSLMIFEGSLLKNLNGLSGAIQLQNIAIVRCKSLEKMPDLSGLPCLQSLKLWWNYEMEEVGGEYLSPTLTHLSICYCPRLKRVGGLVGISTGEHLPLLTHLQHFEIQGCGGLVGKLEVGCLSSLNDLDISDCEALEEIGGVSALHCLETLEIRGCPRLKRVGGLVGISTGEHLPLLTRLQHLNITECGGLVGKLEVGCLRSLNDLTLSGCTAVKEIGGVGALHCLETLKIRRCPRLKRVGGLVGISTGEHLPLLTHLQCLEIEGCGLVGKLEVGCLSSLKYLILSYCDAVEEIGGVSALHCLETLKIQWCPRLKRVGGLVGISTGEHLPFLTHLQCLVIEECDDLVGKLEVGSLSSLTYLHVSYCEAVEEIGGVSALHCLETLKIWRCPRLKRVGGLVGISTGEHLPLLTHLQHLEIQGYGGLVGKLEVGCLSSLKYLILNDCDAVEEIGGVSALHCLETLEITGCPRLRRVGGLVGISTGEHLPLLTHLQGLEIRGCGGLVGTLEVGCLSNLQYLILRYCEAVEEIGDVSVLHCLEMLEIQGCRRLRRVGGLVGISTTHLKRLILKECPSLEASSIPDETHLRQLGIHCCLPVPINLDLSL